MAFYGNGIGGDATVFMDLAEALAARGNEVTLASRADNREIMEKRAKDRGTKIYSVNHWHSWTKETGLDLAQFDIVHLHHCSNYVLGTQARDFAYVFGNAPMVVTLHGPEPLDHFLTVRRGMSARMGARFFKAIVVPSKHKYLDWKKRLYFRGKLHQIPNPIRAVACTDKVQAKKSFGLSPDKPCLLFLGRIRPEKDPAAVLEAVPHLRSLGIEPSLLIAGRGDDDLAAQMQAKAKELDLESNFLGFVTDPAAAYSAADMFLFTSHFDNFPIALFEAGAAGVPIAAVDIAVVKHEFEGRPAVGMAKSGDAESLAQAIAHALKASEADKKALSEQTLGRFGFDAVAAQHEALYSNLAG
jgi:glycosyltransferase involved in cell wall biosynthesis